MVSQIDIREDEMPRSLRNTRGLTGQAYQNPSLPGENFRVAKVDSTRPNTRPTISMNVPIRAYVLQPALQISSGFPNATAQPSLIDSPPFDSSRACQRQHVAGQNYNTSTFFTLQTQSQTAMDDRPDRMRAYRPIAPRHIDIQKQSTPQTPTADEGKPKRASMACLECKKRRTKCSTGSPCMECSNHGRECIYDALADKRRKEHFLSHKQQLENAENNLRYYHGFLENVLASIRLGSTHQLDQLVQVIKDTVRNPDPDNKSGYSKIRETVFSILSEFEDAEGDDETSNVDQSMPQ
ncbi:hypothetical protein ZTR_03449 [Talaromyces verruculosus]|nr:hypothetical protein ZTR_03449 [Talaromyces verruculosus]